LFYTDTFIYVFICTPYHTIKVKTKRTIQLKVKVNLRENVCSCVKFKKNVFYPQIENI